MTGSAVSRRAGLAGHRWVLVVAEMNASANYGWSHVRSGFEPAVARRLSAPNGKVPDRRSCTLNKPGTRYLDPARMCF